MRTLKNVLLVEDNEDDQFLFVKALSKIKNACLYAIANNGKDALDKLENSPVLPDLIFMDVNMPKMNGIECLSELVKKPHTKNIPVVILSTDTREIELIRKLGAKAFIQKPTDYKILCKEIEQMINFDFMTDSYYQNIHDFN